jgi:hypothetical protein
MKRVPGPPFTPITVGNERVPLRWSPRFLAPPAYKHDHGAPRCQRTQLRSWGSAGQPVPTTTIALVSTPAKRSGVRVWGSGLGFGSEAGRKGEAHVLKAEEEDH